MACLGSCVSSFRVLSFHKLNQMHCFTGKVAIIHVVLPNNLEVELVLKGGVTHLKGKRKEGIICRWLGFSPEYLAGPSWAWLRRALAFETTATFVTEEFVVLVEFATAYVEASASVTALASSLEDQEAFNDS